MIVLGVMQWSYLEQNSIIVTLGSINIIDATVIEAKQSRKRKGKDGNNTQDPEAAYNGTVENKNPQNSLIKHHIYSNIL
jgi:hypothetical protein